MVMASDIFLEKNEIEADIGKLAKGDAVPIDGEAWQLQEKRGVWGAYQLVALTRPTEGGNETLELKVLSDGTAERKPRGYASKGFDEK